MKRFICVLVVCASLALLAIIFGWSHLLTVSGAAQNSSPALSQHAEIKIDPQRFDELTGQYVSAERPELVFSFWRENDKFFLQPTGQMKIEIFPESETKFFLKVLDAQATFTRDAAGKVTGALWRQNNRDLMLKKTSNQPAVEKLVSFEKREEMIPMRDGVRLHTVIFAPKDTAEPLPILISRTPYGIAGSSSDGINRRYKELVQDGYVFVLQDIRGRYASEGQFVMNRPPRDKKDLKSIDESSDTYDTIDWLLKNVPKNNGRVGILGVSYGGWLAAVATIDSHPALKASSPQAPMTDTWIGDDFFHNGAFRLTYGYEYVTSMETTKEDTEVAFDKDTYDWYLELGSLSKLTDKLQGKLPTWNAFVAHPNYDAYWKARAAERYLRRTPVATLVVGGWWDQEDFYGTLATYEKLEIGDTDHKNFLVMGPWNHGGWGGSGRSLGAINFGSATGNYFRSEIQAPWFAYYLKDKGKLSQAEAVTFQTGSNKWTWFDRWPPRETVFRPVHLQSGQKLTFQPPPPNNQGFESYTSDPADPVPYRKRPIQATYGPGSGWSTWLVQDQRFLAGRKDVLSWQSQVLDNDLTIAGNVTAELWASTTGSDSDWVVKLIDVYPDDYPEDKQMAGYQLMINEEITRGRVSQRYTKGAAPKETVPLERAEPLEPDAVYEYHIDLHSSNHCFKKGHRIMVQVQSSWFPLYDRNPQKFVENIFTAKPSDYQVATQRVYESSRYPSWVTLHVME